MHLTQIMEKRNWRRSYCSKTLPRVLMHRSRPSPINCPCLYVAHARGLLWVYKSRGLSVPLYLCTGSRSHTCGHAWHGRRSRGTRLPRQCSSQKHEEQRGEMDLPRQHPCRGGLHSPGKSLAGATCPTPARPPPLSLRALTPSTVSRPRLRGALHSGMQIFVKTKGLRV